MIRQPLSSSAIRSAGHDPEKQILEIEMTSGNVYRYAGVDENTFQDFLAAPSAGKFYNQQIKGQYEQAT